MKRVIIALLVGGIAVMAYVVSTRSAQGCEVGRPGLPSPKHPCLGTVVIRCRIGDLCRMPSRCWAAVQDIDVFNGYIKFKDLGTGKVLMVPESCRIEEW